MKVWKKGGIKYLNVETRLLSAPVLKFLATRLRSALLFSLVTGLAYPS